jgi:predicted DNA-binding transcriptional regulator YafY
MTMPRTSDTLVRHWDLLMNVPAHPNWRATRELHERLVDLDHDVDIRTVQRDLERLSAAFPIHAEERGKALHWQWMRGAHGLEIPGMSRSTALVFQQANRFLRPLMPDSVLALLEPYFQRAGEALAHTQLADWERKVMHIDSGPRLTPPEIDPEVRNIVYEALLDGMQFACDYTPRYETEPKHHEVSPLGIVLRQGVTYLVATLWEFDDPRQLALHRIRAARPLERKARQQKDFSLQRYVGEQAAFSYPESAKKIRLKARFDEGAAYHLTERRLADDQQLKPTRDGLYELTATVNDTADLRWWLLGFGDGVEVLGPKGLREEFRAMTRDMAGMYS